MPVAKQRIDRFEPVQSLRDQLRRECTASDGLVFADVRWSEEHQCLAIWWLRQNGTTWIVRNTLTDERGQPRQITHKDIEDCRAAMHEARNMFDAKWYAREIEEHNANVDAAAERAWNNDVDSILLELREAKRRGYCPHHNRPEHCGHCAYASRLR